MTESKLHCPPADETSDSIELAERYGLALDELVKMLQATVALGREQEYDEDLLWETMANRLQYPAHYRLSKRRMAELLGAALVMLSSGPPS